MGTIVAAALLWALPAAAKHQATTVTVTEGTRRFFVKVSAKTVKAGPVTFKVTNEGNLPHDSRSAGTKTAPPVARQVGDADRDAEEGQGGVRVHHQFGHAAAGMKGTLTVS